MTKFNDEIDLTELTLKFVRLIKKHFLLLVAFFIIGIGGAIYKYLSTKPYYNAQMIITTNLEYEKNIDFYSTDLQPLISVLNFLSEKINSNNTDFIINSLNIDAPQDIKEFNVQILKDANLPNLDPKNILIDVVVYNKNILDAIQTSVVDYCNENQFIATKFEEQYQLKQHYLSIIDQRILEIDSLNDKVFSSNSLLLVDFNSLIEVVRIELQKNKIKFFEKYSEPVVVVQEFSDFPNVESKKTIKSIVTFLLFMFLGFVTLIFIEIIKFFKNA